MKRISIDSETHCWNWKGAINSNGYGVVKLPNGNKSAHRYSWMIHKGEILNGMFILHKCDNTLCVNPEHLFLGTQKDNLGDMASKGRSAHGERHGQHKLKDETVLEMVRRYKAGEFRSMRSASLSYGVSHAYLHQLIGGKRVRLQETVHKMLGNGANDE